MDSLLHFALYITKTAGLLVKLSQESVKDIKYKGDFDIVTDIDKISQKFIVNEIKKNYPEHKIISEEFDKNKYDFNGFTWIIDPIDGTVNFSKNFPYYAISVALAKDEEVIIGAIYNPYTDELFYAQKGRGAYLNNNMIKVSNIQEFKDSVIATGFPSKDFRQNPQPYLEVFKNISINSLAVRRCGAAALDLAYLAAGKLDGIWVKGLKLWDIAAGILLVKEAKGIITDYNGISLNIKNYSSTLIASNAKIHEIILKYIRGEI